MDEQTEAGYGQQHRYKQDQPQQFARQQRRFRVPGRALHEVVLGGLECQCQGKGDGGDHVHPEDLQRGNG
ncbi:hypothetical protein D3C84_398560 [compost metagenome]